MKVYCAGPLFNLKEREEMADIASHLEKSGYATFLPQRDGLELTKCVELLIAGGANADEANELMARAIFALDVYQVLHGCDLVVANLNGRVPDEGTVSEAAMAWARGKVVIGYKADSRTAFFGQDNPLVTGLFDFNLCSTIEEICSAVTEAVRNGGIAATAQEKREQEISSLEHLGSEIWDILSTGGDVSKVVQILQGQSRRIVETAHI